MRLIQQTANISIHALHEESDLYGQFALVFREISIHALHEESDLATTHADGLIPVFQSTLSMRRATQHLPATGCSTSDFNPRSP